MYIITCTQATKRFEWELEVLLTNLQSFDYKKIIILFCGGEQSIADKIGTNYQVRYHYYPDERPLKRYPTSNRLYVWCQFLAQFPEMEEESFFYIDTDIILRKKIDLCQFQIDASHWRASDCSSYLQPSYIKKFNPAYFEAMRKIVGLSTASAESFENNSGGAQWLISKPTRLFFEKVYRDSEQLYYFFRKMSVLDKKKKEENTLQSWCADMWAFLWNTAYFGIQVAVEPKLSFSWSANPIAEWEKHDILHNAGVSDSKTNLFFKGEWNEESPIGKELSVDASKCSYYYVEAIKKVTQNGRGGVSV